ncbi:MAG: DUF4193 domain-containing protein [Mycolicibacterium cosmeticum]|nr:DUF4193 domain-containing protein [Mycolicibacterium cosmeticum]
MTTDYDTPRRTETSDSADESVQLLMVRDDTASDLLDAEDMDAVYELPGADLSGEELAVKVLPQQVDEFVCTSCFLVHHRHNMANEDARVCFDCS